MTEETVDADQPGTDQPGTDQLETLPPTTPASVPPATPLGSRYVLESVIGGGATGRVWRGQRRTDGAPVAVKVLHEELTREPDAVVRFLRQRTVLRTLDHPHLVRVHDLVAEGEVLAVVMDLVDGEDLRALAGRNGLRPGQVMVLLGQVAEALAAVHAAGVVHRDVKPENVLVQWRGGVPHALLTDFGLAGAVAGPSDLTRHSQLLGTPAYIAPELVAGRSAVAATDVYALGVMAYELLAGERPFAAPNTAALLRAHLDAEPVRPAGLADPIWELLRAMLAKRPGDRPAAAAVAGELARLHRLQQLPPPVPPPPPTAPRPVDSHRSELSAGPEQQVSQPTTGATRPAPAAPASASPRRRRAPLVLAVVAVGLLGAGAGLWFGRPDGTTAEPPPTPSAPGYHFHALAVTATSPSPGTIELNFPDASGLPGFNSYVIFRGRERIAQVPAGGDVPPYLVPEVDASTDYCWRVAALVESHQPAPSVTVEPACQRADGSHGNPTEAP